MRWREEEQGDVPRNGLRFGLDAERWEPSTFDVLSDFEPLEFVKYVYRDRKRRHLLIVQRPFDSPGDGEPIIIRPHSPPTSLLRRAEEVDPDDDTIWIHAQTYLDELKIELAKLDDMDPRTQGRRFFARLNRHTSDTLWTRIEEQCLGACSPQDFVDPEIVPDYLTTREAIRGRRTSLENQIRDRTYLDDPPTPAVGAPARTEYQHLNDLQAKLFGELSTANLERAFEQFTNGDLRLPMPLTGAIALQPSSGFYFLWGEFWMLAQGLGMAPAEGLRWARMLVLAQEIFVHPYAPVGIPGPNRDFTSYSAGTFRASEMLDENGKDLIRVQYPDPTTLNFRTWLSTRFGQNVRNHLGAI